MPGPWCRAGSKLKVVVLHGIGMVSAQYLRGICLVSPWYLHGICTVSVQVVMGSYLAYLVAEVVGMSGIVALFFSGEPILVMDQS